MSHSKTFSNPALQAGALPPNGSSFNLVNQTNSFNSVFDIKPLDQSESSRIESLLADNFRPGTITEEQVAVDLKQLKALTSHIKAIGRQGIVLIGERVHMARELLKPYKDGTLTKWLELTFGTRKTGYNMLSYYELYQSLPHPDLKEEFKKIPQRIAYILASKKGEINDKAEIIRSSQGMKQEDLTILIQEKFPPSIKDKRSKKSANGRLIDSALKIIKRIQQRKDSLEEENKHDLKSIQNMISSILFE